MATSRARSSVSGARRSRPRSASTVGSRTQARRSGPTGSWPVSSAWAASTAVSEPDELAVIASSWTAPGELALLRWRAITRADMAPAWNAPSDASPGSVIAIRSCFISRAPLPSQTAVDSGA